MKKYLSFLSCFLFFSSIFAQPIRTSWPMKNGDAAHTSNAQIDIVFPLMVSDVIPFVANREAGTILFDNKVYFSCYGNPNSIHCADLISGDSLWSFDVPGTGGGNQFHPAIAHGIVLSGGQGGQGLYGLDANTGNVLWLDTVGSLYDRSPVVYDSLIYISTHQGFRCLEVLTGKVRWKNEEQTLQYCPAVDSLNVYFNAGGIIYAKDRLTGEERWSSQDMPSGHSTSYIISDSTLFVGYNDTICAFLRENGALLWKTALDTNELVYYSSMAALTDSFLITKTLVNGSSSNHYRVIEKATGNIRNTYNVGSFTWSIPTVINGYLVECSFNDIQFYDVMSGDSIYGMTGLSYGNYPAQIVAANDKIVLVGDANNIVVLKSSPSGTKNIVPDFGVELFPNPAHDLVRLQLDLQKASSISIRVVALNGVVVHQENPGLLQAGENRLDVPLKNLAGGIYFIQVQSDDGVVVKKLIVE